MQARFAPAPDRNFLTEAPLHVVVLTYPEVLAVLREWEGVDLPDDGGEPLSALARVPAGLVTALLDATAWRPSSSGKHPDGR